MISERKLQPYPGRFTADKADNERQKHFFYNENFNFWKKRRKDFKWSTTETVFCVQDTSNVQFDFESLRNSKFELWFYQKVPCIDSL